MRESVLCLSGWEEDAGIRTLPVWEGGGCGNPYFASLGGRRMRESVLCLSGRVEDAGFTCILQSGRVEDAGARGCESLPSFSLEERADIAEFFTQCGAPSGRGQRR